MGTNVTVVRGEAVGGTGSACEPTPARWWRLRAIELHTPGIWDVGRVEFVAAGSTVVERISSGHAGAGYEHDHAFADGPTWWGGRPDRDGPGDCFLGVLFDRSVIPTSIVFDDAPGVHRARRIAVDTSADGEHWTEVSSLQLGLGSRRHVAFYAPDDAGSSSAWRLVCRPMTQDSIDLVRRARLLRSGADLEATVTIGCEDGALVAATADVEVALDRIVLELSADASSVLLQRRHRSSADDDGSWRTWRHLGNLRSGRHDLLLHEDPRRITPRRSTARSRASRRPVTLADRRILVLIAAYRDPELANTIRNAIEQAAYPEHLRFAVCHQFDDRTSGQLDDWADDIRFRIDRVDHRESRGCCWARHRTFRLYQDEPYVFQIDAHMRFAARWDARYIDMLESIDAPMPVLTTYPPRYTIDADGSVGYDLESGVQRLYIDELRDDLTTVQKTTPPADLSRPGPSPSIAAGQLFTRGRFCRDVDYDPEMYFAGEEISLAARAFTSGYDLFHPNENLVWHLYDHEHPKHWDDHPDHVVTHTGAVDRLRQLFREGGDGLGRHGLGTVRSLVDFQEHAGVDLGARRVGVAGSAIIEIDRSVVEPRDDYEAFVVVFIDRHGNEVARRELRAPDVLDLTRSRVPVTGLPSDAFEYLVIPRSRTGRLFTVFVHPVGVSNHARNGGIR